MPDKDASNSVTTPDSRLYSFVVHRRFSQVFSGGTSPSERVKIASRATLVAELRRAQD